MNHSIDPLCITKYIIKFAIKRFDDKKKISNSIKILRVDCFEKYRLRPPLSLSRVQKFIEGWPIPYATMLSARRLSFIVRRNFLSSNRRNCRQEAGKGRIRRRAVFEKLGYGSTGALTLISAHLCPRLRVHVLRVSRPAKHRSRAQCTPEFHSLYTHARAQICLFHRYNRYIPQLRTLVVHRSCLLCLVVNSSSTIIFFFYPFFILLETPPIYVFLGI